MSIVGNKAIIGVEELEEMGNRGRKVRPDALARQLRNRGQRVIELEMDEWELVSR